MAKSARERYEERLRVSTQLLSGMMSSGNQGITDCDVRDAILAADLLIAKLEKDLGDDEAAERKYFTDEPATPGLDAAGQIYPSSRFLCISTRCPKGVWPGEKACHYGNCIERRDA